MTVALGVIAKAPVAGRSKTRLCPPCTPEQAAGLACAALRDTLAAVSATPGVDRRVLILDGEPGWWMPPGFEIVGQRGDDLAERLAAAFEDVGGPMLVVGMDTPQLTPGLLAAAINALDADVAAVLGAACDGGYWGIGLHAPDAAVFDGVPMSEVDTGAAQRSRLRALGMSVRELAPLRDVDTFADAVAVAAGAPETEFAASMAALQPAGLAA